MSENRNFIFKGLCNFREIGGIENKDGLKLKNRMLLRSDDLAFSAREDRRKISSLGVKTVIDLRMPNERNYKPVILNGIPKIISIPLYVGLDMNRREYFKMLVRFSGTTQFDDLLKNIYLQLAFERMDVICSVFNVLADEKNYPVMIHCTAGKDRTGFVSALIQLAADVSYEKVIMDYEETNRFIEKRIRKTGFMIRLMSGFRISKDQLKPMFEVRPENLDNALREIMKRHGTILNYLQSCGITSEQIEAVRKIILN